MKTQRLNRCLPFLSLLFAASVTRAGLAQSSPAHNQDNPLPVPVSPDNFQALMTNSPFERVLDFSTTYSLRGVAQIENESVAWLYNRETKETVAVRENEANRLGMTLVSVTNDPNDLKGVSVRVMVGGEGIDLSYDATQLTPKPPQVKYDRAGRSIPPQHLIDKFRSMTREQMGKYQTWRRELVKKHPEMDKSPKRFPIAEKAIDAIKSGKPLPRP